MKARKEEIVSEGLREKEREREREGEGKTESVRARARESGRKKERIHPRNSAWRRKRGW